MTRECQVRICERLGVRPPGPTRHNASTALGPFLRLFDETFSLDDVRHAEVVLRIEGEDGFELDGVSAMDRISRDPEDLVA